MHTEHFAIVSDALRGRYRLERVLQHGLVADVYVGEDRLLGRRVAVKVLRDEMASTVTAERFMAEIDVARQLRHPNIVPMYDSGDIAGVPYYIMPFIEGRPSARGSPIWVASRSPRRSGSQRISPEHCISRIAITSCIATSSQRT